MNMLVHMCCGPCAVYPVEELINEGINLKGLFYNPNIHPKEEYEKRKDNVKKFSDITNTEVYYIDEYRQEIWDSFNGEQNDRCDMCYKMRLYKVAKFAKEKGFDAFTTTLLVSPYQNHNLIRKIGEEASLMNGVKFFYMDFRHGFRAGQNSAREMGLYRQKYCGCIKSKY
ncbi:UNVERIFIED_CONTAM: hypothetical protein Cloal_2806 [Acetivibrio alkalicellulosi]